MKNFKLVLILIVLSYLFFMLGNSIMNLTNPDEVFYTQTAKEMMQQKTWMVPYLFGQPQFEKPIMTYWFLRLGFNMFGVTNFGARFFPALFAIIGVLAVYWLSLSAYRDRKKAFICALVLMSSGLYVGLGRTVFTDMIFTVFILLSLASFYWGYANPARKNPAIVLFYIFSALAVLTKGPLGFIIPLIIVLMFLGIKKDLKFIFCWSSLWGLLLFGLIALPWYVAMINKYKDGFIREFFYNDHIRRVLEAEHKGNDKWYFYPLSAILCMFPWSVFVSVSLFFLPKWLKEKKAQPIYLFLFCWIAVIFVVFQSAHSKLVSYVFPMFPALAILTGDLISNAINSDKRKIFVLSLVTWCIFALLPIGLVICSRIYSMYVPSMELIYNFIYIYMILLMAMLLFILKKKILANLCIMAFLVPFCLFYAFAIDKYFDAYVSSKEAGEYLMKNHKVENAIICSKIIARGMRFYTDKDVAVFDLGGAKFFSPHPIPSLDSYPKIDEFLKKQPVAYGVLNKSGLSDIRQYVSARKLKLTLLKVIGNESVVLIQPN